MGIALFPAAMVGSPSHVLSKSNFDAPPRMVRRKPTTSMRLHLHHCHYTILNSHRIKRDQVLSKRCHGGAHRQPGCDSAALTHSIEFLEGVFQDNGVTTPLSLVRPGSRDAIFEVRNTPVIRSRGSLFAPWRVLSS